MPGAMPTPETVLVERKNERRSVSQVWSGAKAWAAWRGEDRHRIEPIALLPRSAAEALPAMQFQVVLIPSFLPPFVGKGLEAPATPHDRAGRRRGGEKVHVRAFLHSHLPAPGLSREFLLFWPRESRVFHKYL